MKVTIEIEEFDNGITLKWKDTEGKTDEEAVVALDQDKETAIGKMIWSDVENTLNYELVDKVKMKIEYEPIKDEQ
ncbi:MAG: hypothetical protein J6S52_00520 [Prevotella sp.]|nr:hypothetical protein [Prevotella sp.]MBP5714376.1 hypothetical protein [Prevotella sp.]